MDKTEAERQEKLLAILSDIAKDVIEVAKADPTTKDGYGAVLRFVTHPKVNAPTGRLILMAMVKQGYPSDTANSVARIAGFQPLPGDPFGP